jgi:hypothetical protein
MKHTPLFICLFLFLNISAQNSKTEKLIGKWKLIKEIENGKETSTKCTRKTTVEFLNNGTYNISEFVEESEIDNTCTPDLRNGKWKNIGNSKYVFNEKNMSEIIFENETYYYISESEKYTIKYVYSKIID